MFRPCNSGGNVAYAGSSALSQAESCLAYGDKLRIRFLWWKIVLNDLSRFYKGALHRPLTEFDGAKAQYSSDYNNSRKRIYTIAMTPLDEIQERIYNEGERLIPHVTHNEEEWARHHSSYLFFRDIIFNDIANGLLLNGQEQSEGPIRILDLGFGVGHGCKTLSEIPGVEVTGIDISSDCLAYANEHYAADNVTYKISDIAEFIQSLGETGESFDYIVSRGVLEHIPDGINLLLGIVDYKRIIVDVPYDEDSPNPHHVMKGIREDVFDIFSSRELYYETLDGAILKKKTIDVNMILAVISNPVLPPYGLFREFPIPGWTRKTKTDMPIVNLTKRVGQGQVNTVLVEPIQVIEKARAWVSSYLEDNPDDGKSEENELVREFMDSLDETTESARIEVADIHDDVSVEMKGVIWNALRQAPFRLLDNVLLDHVQTDTPKKTNSVLEIGPGVQPQTVLNPSVYYAIEPCSDYFEYLKTIFDGAKGVHLINDSAPGALDAFADQSIDVAVLCDLIEHLPKEDSRELLKACCRIARHQVVVFAPLGYFPQYYTDAETEDLWHLQGAQWQSHLSGWSPSDFGSDWTCFVAPFAHEKTFSDGTVFASGAMWAVYTNPQLSQTTADSPLKQEDDLSPEATDCSLVYMDRVQLARRLRDWEQGRLASKNQSRNTNISGPFVTVITPAYNREDYLPETIESIQAQDYPRFEHLILDDGSSDGTLDVIRSYAEKDSRIRWDTHPNMRETRTVNKAIGMARGDLIVILNSDDVLYPNAISRAVAFMAERPDVLVAYPDWDYIDEHSKPYSHVEVEEFDYLRMVSEHRCMMGPGAFIRSKAFELAGLRDPSLRYVADFDFFLRVGLYGPMARIPETLATWRAHAGALTVAAKGSRMAKEDIIMMRRYFARPDLPERILAIRNRAWRNARLHAARVSGRAWVCKCWNYALACGYDLLVRIRAR